MPPSPSMSSDAHSAKVANFFGEPDRYLGSLEPTARKALVRELARPSLGGRVLDVGCGDGSLSLQLLPSVTSVHLVDASEGMLRVASGNIPEADASRVRLSQGTLDEVDLSDEPYDLVLLIGVLAHVPDIGDALKKLALSMKVGARLVIQFSDNDMLSYLPQRAWRRMRERMGSGYGYTLNPITEASVRAALRGAGLVWEAPRRYMTLPPVVRRLASPAMERRYNLWTLAHPLGQQFGHEVLVACRKEAVPAK